MAIQIEFSGYINEVKKFEWGTVYDISHAQRQQSESGQWETVGYDYFSVIGDPGFEKDQRVTVKGRLKTKKYDKRDGTKGTTLEVRAEYIELVKNAKADANAPF
jgi:hypothetical protein